MKYYTKHRFVYLISLILLTVCLLLINTGCSKNTEHQVDGFSNEAVKSIKKKSKHYTIAKLSQGNVTANTYVAVKGKITKKDRSGSKINKGDRFILKDGKHRVQVLASNKANVRVGQNVIVYGEYYGLIKSYLIESVK